MHGEPAGVGVKSRDVVRDKVEVERKKHLPFLLIGTEKIFGVVAQQPARDLVNHGSVLVVALP